MELSIIIILYTVSIVAFSFLNLKINDAVALAADNVDIDNANKVIRAKHFTRLSDDIEDLRKSIAETDEIAEKNSDKLEEWAASVDECIETLRGAILKEHEAVQFLYSIIEKVAEAEKANPDNVEDSDS